MKVKTLLFAYEDVSELKKSLNSINLSEGMKSFVKTINSNKNNKYRIIVEFEDDRYATLKVGNFLISNISNECVKYGSTCSLDEIKSQVSLTIAVNDEESYKFNVLDDNGEKLTLIMDDYLSSNVKWGSSLNSGPISALEYLEAETKDWINVSDIAYTLNNNSCNTYSDCNSNVYSLSTRNAKARLPKLQELVALGCTETSGSCPLWLSNGLDGSNITDFWTSSTSSNNAWTLSFENKLKETSIDSNLRIKPVIVIDKSGI